MHQDLDLVHALTDVFLIEKKNCKIDFNFLIFILSPILKSYSQKDLFLVARYFNSGQITKNNLK